MSLTLFSPQLVLAVGGTFLLLLEAFGTKRERALLPAFTMVIILLAGVLLWLLNGKIGLLFAGMIIFDRFFVFFGSLVLLGSLLAVAFSASSLREQDAYYGEFYPLVLFSALGMLLLISAANMVIVFLGMEIMSIPLYIMAALRRSSNRSVEAGAKYFLMGAFASGFLLYGIALVYGATGSLGLEEIAAAWAKGAGLSFIGISGMLLILVGLGFKIAAVPFHMWEPDAYEGAPTAVTAFFAAGPKIAAFAILLRLITWTFSISDPIIWRFVWMLAVMSMTVGNFLALTQNSVKRMLAYSGIAHAGYALIGLAVGGTAAIGLLGYYLLGYFLAAVGAFAVVAAWEARQERSLSFDDCAGRAKTHPGLSLALALFMISLAGIPPVAGFVGKFYLFEQAIQNGFVWLVIIAAINSIVSVYYYLRVPVYCFMKPADGERPPASVSPGLIFTLAFTALALVVIGVYPGIFIELASSSAMWFF
jgi:NADH-quinone oxidoreductase subunit N